MRLRTVPFTIDVEPLAAGLLKLFTPNEKAVLRFGMLPAEKIESFERLLTERFSSLSTPLTESLGRDDFTATVKRPDDAGYDVIDFSMRDLVKEAMHEVCCQLYRIGDLVV